MKQVTPILVFAALVAGPLAAQHTHPGTPQPTAPAGASARPMMSGMGGMMRPGMDTMMGSHGMPAMMRGMAGMDSLMPAMHAMMAYAPAALLDRRAELRLDDDQASRLSRLAAGSRAAHDSAMMTAQHQRRTLSDAVAAGGDPAAAVRHFTAMHEAMGLAHAAHLRAALEARAMLTAGQRSLVEAAAHQHGGSR